MSGKKRRKTAPSATPWDNLGDDNLTPAQALVRATHRSAYDFRHQSFAGDIDFFNGFAREACPRCGCESISKRGHDRAGMQRYLCGGCKKGFSSVTGTIFDDRKLPLSAWVDFLLQLFSFESIGVMTRESRRSETTIPYWIGKVFAVLDGSQDGIVLSGKVQIRKVFER